jgi:hypothetical protein
MWMPGRVAVALAMIGTRDLPMSTTIAAGRERGGHDQRAATSACTRAMPPA